MQKLKENKRMNSNIIVDETLDATYAGKVLFPEKLKEAISYCRGRDINAEIEKAKEKYNNM